MIDPKVVPDLAVIVQFAPEDEPSWVRTRNLVNHHTGNVDYFDEARTFYEQWTKSQKDACLPISYNFSKSFITIKEQYQKGELSFDEHAAQILMLLFMTTNELNDVLGYPKWVQPKPKSWFTILKEKVSSYWRNTKDQSESL